MDRRDFMNKAGCRFAALMAAPLALDSALAGQEQTPPAPRRKYKLEIEIFEARPDTWCHKKGDKFSYPQEIGKICPWLLSSMHDFLIVLAQGAVLPWKYENTPYQKVIDPDGVTTEFVRCPDPTSNLVAKITRLDDSRLTELFGREVLADLVRKQLLSPEWAERILSWHHTGFNVHSRVRAKTKREAERVGKYMIRPLLSLERLSFDDPPPHLAYQEVLMAAEAGSEYFS